MTPKELLIASLWSIVAESEPVPFAPLMTNPALELLAVTRVRTAVTLPVPATCRPKPVLPTFVIVVSWMSKTAAVAGNRLKPSPKKSRITQFCMVMPPPVLNSMPCEPALLPVMVRPRRLTMTLAGALIVMAAPAVVTATPATPTPSFAMVMALVIVSAPYPPGSSTSISPAAATWSCAYWNDRHGLVGALQPGASTPCAAETQTRVGAACD